MNRPIMRLYGLIALMFAVLIGFTSRWTIFQASALRENPLNRRQLLESERIQRGPIVAADGTVLARSVPAAEGTFTRVYPTGELFAHAVGYYYTDLGSSGLERYRQEQLTGRTGTNQSGFSGQFFYRHRHMLLCIALFKGIDIGRRWVHHNQFCCFHSFLICLF